jgi:transposase
MQKIPRMPRNERRNLIRIGRRSGEPETAMRFLTVSQLAAGRSGRQVARELDIARSTVGRTAHRFVTEGVDGLFDQRRTNGNTKADPAFLRRLVVLLRGSPEDFGWMRPTWTRELLCLQMQRDGWPSVAVCTMGRALARLGARLGCPKPIVLCPWPRDARLQRLAEIRGLERCATASEPVLYGDEVDIHLNPKIGRDWMLPGHQRRVVTPGKNQKFYVAGALDVRTGQLHTTGAHRKGAALFCDLLGLLAAQYPRARCIHLIVDNYGVHKSDAVRRLLDRLQDRVVLHFLPPYCPDANRIERVWQDLHANVTRNHRCKTMNRLLANARRYLQAYRWHQATGTAALLSPAA